MLLDLLGWRYEKNGPKADSMSDRVSSVGVEFNLRESAKGLKGHLTFAEGQPFGEPPEPSSTP